MRLGDLDALKDALFQKHVHDGEELEPMLYLDDAMKVVDEAPTIDAIPVEWLEKRRQNLILAAMVHSTVYGDNSIELCHAVNVVLDMWQKEQEVRI